MKGNENQEESFWNRDQLVHNVELSLKRMKTDVLDIWQLHNPSVAEIESGELVAAMEQVKAQGKVRHVSISSRLPDDVYQEAKRRLDEIGERQKS